MMAPVRILQWSLAVVLALGALLLLLDVAGGASVHIAPPIAAALGVAELAAAVLFAVPATRRVGAVALWVLLAAAVVVHALHRQAPPPAFVVYAAAIWVVM